MDPEQPKVPAKEAYEELSKASQEHAEKLQKIEDPAEREKLAKAFAEKVQKRLPIIKWGLDHPDESVQKLARDQLKPLRDLFQSLGAHGKERFQELAQNLNEQFAVLIRELEEKYRAPTLDKGTRRLGKGPRESLVSEAWHAMSREEQLQALIKGNENFRLTPEQVRRQKQVAMLVTAVQGVGRVLDKGGDTLLQKAKFKIFGKGNLEAIRREGGVFLNEVAPAVMKGLAENKDQSMKSLLQSRGAGQLVHALEDEGISTSECGTEERFLQQKLTVIQWLRKINDYDGAQALCQEELQAPLEKVTEKYMIRDGRETVQVGNVQKEVEVISRDWILAKNRFEGKEEEVAEELRNADPEHAAEAERKAQQYVNALTYQHYLHLEHEDLLSIVNNNNLSLQWPRDFQNIWNEYRDSMGIGFALSDKHWNMVLDELVINAPLILLSGGIAAGARAAGAEALSYGARAVLGAARVEEIALSAGRIGRLGSAAAGLLVEGAVFEMTNAGLRGEWLFDAPDWAQRILWGSASLGAFKAAGKLGEKLVGKEGLLKGMTEKIGDVVVRKGMEELIIKGHLEVAAMLMIGAIQNGVYHGNLDEFIDNFGEELFHAYVSVGALKLSGKIVSGFEGGKGKPEKEYQTQKEEEMKREQEAYEKIQSLDALFDPSVPENAKKGVRFLVEGDSPESSILYSVSGYDARTGKVYCNGAFLPAAAAEGSMAPGTGITKEYLQGKHVIFDKKTIKEKLEEAKRWNQDQARKQQEWRWNQDPEIPPDLFDAGIDPKRRLGKEFVLDGESGFVYRIKETEGDAIIAEKRPITEDYKPARQYERKQFQNNPETLRKILLNVEKAKERFEQERLLDQRNAENMPVLEALFDPSIPSNMKEGVEFYHRERGTKWVVKRFILEREGALATIEFDVYTQNPDGSYKAPERKTRMKGPFENRIGEYEFRGEQADILRQRRETKPWEEMSSSEKKTHLERLKPGDRVMNKKGDLFILKEIQGDQLIFSVEDANGNEGEVKIPRERFQNPENLKSIEKVIDLEARLQENEQALRDLFDAFDTKPKEGLIFKSDSGTTREVLQVIQFGQDENAKVLMKITRPGENPVVKEVSLNSLYLSRSRFSVRRPEGVLVGAS